MTDLADRVRRRLREEMARRHLSQQDVADLLRWTQSRVAQKINGRTPITLNELEALCFAVGMLPSEMVRDQGLEFSAEMTPTELRTLELLRGMTKEYREIFTNLIKTVSGSNAMPETRSATGLRSTKIPKGGHR